MESATFKQGEEYAATVARMERYTERAGISRRDQLRYGLLLDEMNALYQTAKQVGLCEALHNAFLFGRAKGYRAAKREQERSAEE